MAALSKKWRSFKRVWAPSRFETTQILFFKHLLICFIKWISSSSILPCLHDQAPRVLLTFCMHSELSISFPLSDRLMSLEDQKPLPNTSHFPCTSIFRSAYTYLKIPQVSPTRHANLSFSTSKLTRHLSRQGHGNFHTRTSKWHTRESHQAFGHIASHAGRNELAVSRTNRQLVRIIEGA